MIVIVVHPSKYGMTFQYIAYILILINVDKGKPMSTMGELSPMPAYCPHDFCVKQLRNKPVLASSFVPGPSSLPWIVQYLQGCASRWSLLREARVTGTNQMNQITNELVGRLPSSEPAWIWKTHGFCGKMVCK